MRKKANLVFPVAGADSRQYGILVHLEAGRDFWGREKIKLECTGILDFDAGRAFSLEGEPIGEDRNQSLVSGTTRILQAGGWPRAKSEEGEPVELPETKIVVLGEKDKETIDL